MKAVVMQEKDLSTPAETTAAAPPAKTRAIAGVFSNDVQTTVYSQSSYHQRNLDIITKKEETSIRTPLEATAAQAPVQPQHRGCVIRTISGDVMDLGATAETRMGTREEIDRALESWRNTLIKSGDYVPQQHRSRSQHLEKIRVLKGTMSDYAKFNPTGLNSLTFQHGKFEPLQREYNIPMHYADPEKFFKAVQSDPNIVYMMRMCSVWDFYDFLSKDTPGYRHNPNYGDRKSGIISVKDPETTAIRAKNIAHNPFPKDGGKSPPRGKLAPNSKFFQRNYSTSCVNTN
jgi:hypothetical protein